MQYMKSYDLIEILHRAKKPVITTNDIAKFANGNKKYASLLAKRLVKRRLLIDIEKGKYALPETPIFAIASGLVFPAYISFLTGLYLNELVDQLPILITLVTHKPRKELKINQTLIRFVTLPISKFFGYRKITVEGWPVFLAEPEKAIADSLYLPKHCCISYVQESLLSEHVDKRKLIGLVKKFYPPIVLKRLISILPVKETGSKYDK